MKKFISVVLLTILLIVSILPICGYAYDLNEERRFTCVDEEIVEYFNDENGDYILKDGEKEYIIVIDSFKLVTDYYELKELKSDIAKAKATNSFSRFNETMSSKSSKVVYSGKLDFSATIATTPIIALEGYNYYYLKCSDLNPSGAKRGFSHYVMFTVDQGATWYQYDSPFVNYSLSLYTRFSRARLGNPQYIKIKMWSYYGTVDSCTLSVKLADA